MHHPASKGQIAVLGIFTAAYMLAAAVGVVVTGNNEFVFYLVVMLVLLAMVIALHLRVGLSAGVLWGLTIWGALHMAGGLVPVPESWPINGDIRVLYSWWIWQPYEDAAWLKYDQLVHAYGFGIATWLCWQAMNSAIQPVRPGLGLAVLSALAGLGLGAANEIVEFIAVLMVPETNVGGYENTGWDLVFNAIGCVIAGVGLYASATMRSGSAT